MKTNRRSGMTLLEMAIVTAILAAIFGGALLVERSTGGVLSQTSTIGLLEEKAMRSLEAVASEARWADPGSLLITQENGSDRLDLRVPTGYAAGAPAWSTDITYRVEPSGFDANEDGVLDEGKFVREQDGTRRVLCEYVTQGGFSAQYVGDTLVLQFQLAKLNDRTEQVLTSDVQTTVSLRN